jgi:hypothetical protein
MWFKCDLDICGYSVECEVLMCDGKPEELYINPTSSSIAFCASDLLNTPHVVKAIMKCYDDYIGE